jgi:hypothetical protein
MSMAHGQDKCEVNVVIPLNPMEPWMATVIGVELDETVEQTYAKHAHASSESMDSNLLAPTTNHF